MAGYGNPAVESFLTGAFSQGARDLADYAERERERKARERRINIIKKATIAFQEYQTTGKAVDPRLAAEAASVGFQIPSAAIRGLDLSTLMGGTGGQAPPIAGGMESPGTGQAGAPQSMSGGKITLESAWKSGLLTEAEYGKAKMAQQAQQAENAQRAAALTDLQNNLLDFGQTPVKERTPGELGQLYAQLQAVDPSGISARKALFQYLGLEAVPGKGGAGGKDEKWNVIDSLLRDKDGNPRPYEDFSSIDKMQLSYFGFSEKELKDAYELADDDKGAASIAKIKQRVATAYLDNAMFFMLGKKDVGVKELQKMAKVAFDFLEGNAMPPGWEWAVDYIKAMKTTASKREIRKQMETDPKFNEMPKDKRDELIDLLLRVAYR